jgi:DNA-directed RNA polymerase specialized sigma24 family protein
MSEEQPAVEKTAPDPSIRVDLHGDYLYRYATFRLHDSSQAEDVVQEKFAVSTGVVAAKV